MSNRCRVFGPCIFYALRKIKAKRPEVILVLASNQRKPYEVLIIQGKPPSPNLEKVVKKRQCGDITLSKGHAYIVVVDWDNGKIKLAKDDTCIELEVESDIARINGVDTKLNYKVFLVDNTSYVPLRVISESFGLDVEWDDSLKAVLLK